VISIYRPSTNKESTVCFRKYLKQFIDFYNWGYNKRFAYETETICSVYNDLVRYENLRTGKKWAYYDTGKIKLRDNYLDLHLKSPNLKETFYFTANPNSDIILLMIDLDPKSSTTDSDYNAAISYIFSNYHNSSYLELSSTGRGRSIYFLFDVTPFKTTTYYQNEVIDYIKRYSTLLKKDVNKKFNINFDKICGLMRCKKEIYVKKSGLMRSDYRGILGKIPCPQTDKQRGEFYGLQPITKEQIDKNIKELSGGLVAHLNPSSKSSPSLRLLIEPKTPSTNQKPATPLNPNILLPTFTKTEKLMYCKCPYKRTLGAILYLSHKVLKRTPTEDEYYQFYMEMNLFTGGKSVEEKQRRIDRYKEAIKTVEKTFDVEKCKLDYDINNYKKNIENSISLEEIQNIRKECGFRGKLTYEDLLVGFGYHVLCAFGNNKPGRELTCPMQGLIDYFKSLTVKKIINRGCNMDKVKAIRAVLLKIKWIELLDDKWVFTGNKRDGIAKKYTMGVDAPNFKEFMIVRGEVVKQVKKSMQAKTLEILNS